MQKRAKEGDDSDSKNKYRFLACNKKTNLVPLPFLEFLEKERQEKQR